MAQGRKIIRYLSVTPHSTVRVLSIAIFGLLCACSGDSAAIKNPNELTDKTSIAKQTSKDDPLIALANRYQAAHLTYNQPAAYLTGVPIQRHDKFFANALDQVRALYDIEDEILTDIYNLNPKPSPHGDELKRHIFYKKFVEYLEASRDQRICKNEYWDYDHFFNGAFWLQTIIPMQPLATEQDRADALARWTDAARYFRDQKRNYQAGIAEGYSVPKRVVNRVTRQLDAILTAELDEHPYIALSKRSENDAFQAAFKTILTDDLLPAMAAFNDYLKDEYLEQARTTLSLSAHPNGRECYMASYRFYTTLKRTPEEVHQIGSDAVAANIARVVKLGQNTYGLASFDAIIARANGDETEAFSDSEDLQAFFESVVKRSESKMPEYFDRLPEIALRVDPVPKNRQGTGMTAHYVGGTKEHPAKFAYDPTGFGNYTYGSAEIVAVHEGYPGHHLERGRPQEVFHPLENLFSNSAYSEGWGRYAEQLAEEAGIYKTQSAKILRRAWPARGMVGDTGLHMMGWSNEKTAEYLQKSGASFTKDIDTLLDRMAVWPAQLTAYDSGALELIAIRETEKARLGRDFDIKRFHRKVLENGALPIDLLREIMDENPNPSD